ncbi:MAG: sugar ABC transporter permease [Treponema sp.]|nr:sugar ABC transporter permease [Treponema sp.]
MKQKYRSGGFENKTLGYIMTIPTTVLILLISIYPLINGILLSFENYNLMRPFERRFIGLENFKTLITTDTEFYSVLAYSFIYTISVVGLSYLIGFVLAMLLKGDTWGRGIYRTVLLLPWVVAPTVAATNWSWLLNDQIGFINKILVNWHILDEAALFLADPRLSRITVIVTGTWRSFPFMMVVIMAGLQSIPKELYESAHMDGAGFFRSLFSITIPMIKSVSTICLILMFLWTFNNFENIYLLTKGGPNNATYTLPILTYFSAFFRSRISYASTIATFMLVVLLVFSMIQLWLQKIGKDN